jgi:hypothetical protein
MPQYRYCFGTPAHIEEKILDDNGAVVGTIRIKPSNVMWKATRKRQIAYR